MGTGCIETVLALLCHNQQRCGVSAVNALLSEAADGSSIPGRMTPVMVCWQKSSLILLPWRCDIIPRYQMELSRMEYLQCTGWAWHQSRLLKSRRDQMWGKWRKPCQSLSTQPRRIKRSFLCLHSIKSQHIIALYLLIKDSALHEPTRGGLWSQRWGDVANKLFWWLPLIALMDCWLDGIPLVVEWCLFARIVLMAVKRQHMILDWIHIILRRSGWFGCQFTGLSTSKTLATLFSADRLSAIRSRAITEIRTSNNAGCPPSLQPVELSSPFDENLFEVHLYVPSKCALVWNSDRGTGWSHLALCWCQ